MTSGRIGVQRSTFLKRRDKGLPDAPPAWNPGASQRLRSGRHCRRNYGIKANHATPFSLRLTARYFEKVVSAVV